MAIKWFTNTIVVTSIHVGANPAASARNVKEWIRNIAVAHSGLECEVKGTDDVVVPGLYQKLLLQHHAEIERVFASFRQWGYQCDQGRTYVGKYFAIAPGGRGSLAITPKSLGPFQ